MSWECVTGHSLLSVCWSDGTAVERLFLLPCCHKRKDEQRFYQQHMARHFNPVLNRTSTHTTHYCASQFIWKSTTAHCKPIRCRNNKAHQMIGMQHLWKFISKTTNIKKEVIAIFFQKIYHTKVCDLKIFSVFRIQISQFF